MSSDIQYTTTNVHTIPTKKEEAGGVKYDDGKVDFSLLPMGPLEDVAKVWTFGKQKYNAWNWTKGFKYLRVYSAALRHIFASMRGEDTDPESKLPHLAHAICCLMMLLEFQATNTGEDDRYVRGKR